MRRDDSPKKLESFVLFFHTIVIIMVVQVPSLEKSRHAWKLLLAALILDYCNNPLIATTNCIHSYILEIPVVRNRRNQTNLLCFSFKQMKLPRLYQFHVREKISMPGCCKRKPLQCDAPYRGHLTSFVTS